MAAIKIGNFTKGLSYDEFLENELVAVAVIKNILVIGEATEYIPEEIRSRNSHIEWRKIARMRVLMIHSY